MGDELYAATRLSQPPLHKLPERVNLLIDKMSHNRRQIQDLLVENKQDYKTLQRNITKIAKRNVEITEWVNNLKEREFELMELLEDT